MVGTSLVSIRDESASLNISKGGSTSLYVDQTSPTADDKNDGFDWSRPLLTIGAAIAKATPWTEIWVKTGTYLENLIISHQNIKLHGVIQDGADRVIVSPATGIPLTLSSGYCEVDGIAFKATNNHCIKANYPGHLLHDLYVEILNSTVSTYAAIYLDDSDYTVIRDSYLYGNNNANVIGILLDGGSVDNLILGNYITGFGDGLDVGYAIGIDDAQRCAILPNGFRPNRIVDNYLGVYFYVNANYRGHSVIHNLFAQQDSYDVYDPNDPDVSGIVLRENCYAYTGWMEDRDHNGRADIVVDAYSNKDYLPLSSPWSHMTASNVRL
jgi:hypothetical protein